MITIYCDSSLTEVCVVAGVFTRFIEHSRKVTVNEGEYYAIIHAILQSTDANVPALIRSDSQLIVNQINGVYKCHQPNLLPLRDTARDLIKDRDIIIRWIPREENLAGIALEKRK